MCSVQGGVQLLKDAAGVVVSPIVTLLGAKNILLDEEDSDSTTDTESPNGEVPLAKTCPPQTLSFDAPTDAAPGMIVCLQGPHGPLRVPLPDDVQAGKPCSIRLGPQEHYSIPVPENAEPGTLMEFQGAQGETFYARLPPGMKAGEEFKVSPPIVLVQVPPRTKPGQKVSYMSPVGHQLTTTVPPGLGPGHYFGAFYELPPSDDSQPQVVSAHSVQATPVPSTMSAPPRQETGYNDEKPAEAAKVESPPVAVVETPEGPKAAEEEKKSPVATGSRGKTCAECGTAFAESQKFCGECGVKRPAQ